MLRAVTPSFFALLSATYFVACRPQATLPGAGADADAGASDRTPATPSNEAAAAAIPTPTQAKPGARLEDLVRATPASIVVSSTVDNPRDYPSHLVDGRFDTAWNSKSGDLVGAHVTVYLPRDATFEQVRLTSGFDKRSAKGDLFTMNHRIEEVEVTLDGRSLGTFPLDTNERGLQTLHVRGPGAPLRITVTKVTPGEKKEWREIVMSELVVLGTPGASLRTNEPIDVHAEATPDPAARLCLDPFTCSETAHAPTTVFANFDLLFKEVKERSARAWKKNAPIDRYDRIAPTTDCRFQGASYPLPAPASYPAGTEPFDRVGTLEWTEGRRFHHDLVVATSKGVRVISRANAVVTPPLARGLGLDDGDLRMESDSMWHVHDVHETGSKLDGSSLVFSGEASVTHQFWPSEQPSAAITSETIPTRYELRIPIPKAGKAPEADRP